MAIISPETPPPSVQPNIADHSSDGYIMYIVGGILMVIMYTTVGLALYAKLTIRKRIASYDSVKLGKYGTHMYDMSAAQNPDEGFIITYFANWMTALVWPFAKSSFFLMYLEMFRTITWQRYAIYFGLFVNWAFYAAILVTILSYTTPAPGQTWAQEFSSLHYDRTLNWAIPISSGNLIIDLYILVLPMAPIWNLQMRIKKRLGVMVIFATGLLACIASSLRIYLKTDLIHHEEDISYYEFPVLVMGLVEMCLGISASSMPSLVLLIRHNGSGLIRVLSRITSRTPFYKSQREEFSDQNDFSGDSDRFPLENILPAVSKRPSPMVKIDDRHNRRQDQSVRTYIEADCIAKQVTRDQIHMNYGFDVEYEDQAYAGSKRATQLTADTLRLELVPFNAKARSDTTCTLGQTCFGDFRLPESSLDRPIEETIAARAQGVDGIERILFMDHSAEVVAQIWKGATGRLWCGANTASTKVNMSGQLILME
ncbi:hypothetical protein N7466_001975 [Penicillium verhagenii]|uniref:uncharacterized protein n=1 Tax=Penicillium verhagenii TaxID=1562060 RepID=UPI002544F0DF|nr:uncharacterized protein N7466_001975 [Penicillium verhagenii]KAJ5938841.1 hypothetical protein N7466_001975 [Penicillium verhagenii]